MKIIEPLFTYSMKKTLLTLFVVLSAFTVFSQTLPALDNVKLVAKEDYRAADTITLQVDNYLLSNPIDLNPADRLKAGQYLLKWMEGTPDHTFSLGQDILKYVEKDVDLMAVYFAALTRFAIKNKEVKDDKTMQLGAMKDLVAYVDKPSNNVKMTRLLKKLSEANQKNELQSFLKL